MEVRVTFHKYGNAFRPNRAKGNWPGVSEGSPRVEEEQRYAPRQGLQELPAPLPLPGRIRLLQYSGGFASLTPG